MADTTLEELQKLLQKIVDSIRAKKNEQQTYLDKANEVQEVYNRLLQDKRTMKEDRNEIKSFYGTSYTDFVGDNYKNKYKPKVKDLLNSYDQVIRLIDRNLDQLNNEILLYKNQASNCWGILGSLQRSYNTVKTKIQNWTN